MDLKKESAKEIPSQFTKRTEVKIKHLVDEYLDDTLDQSSRKAQRIRGKLRKFGYFLYDRRKWPKRR